MTTTVERLGVEDSKESISKKLGQKWRKPFPLNGNKKDHSSRQTIEVNSAFLDKIEQFEPPANELIPLWKEGFSLDLEDLNIARLTYQSVQSSLDLEHRSDYSFSIQKELIDISNEFKDIRGSYYANANNQGLPFGRGITSSELTKIKSELQAAHEGPHKNILRHTRRWVRYIFARERIIFTEELTNLIEEITHDTVRVLTYCNSDKLIEEIKKKIKASLQRSNIVISFIPGNKLKEGTMLEKVFQLAILGLDISEIYERLPMYPRKKVVDTLQNLRHLRYVPRYTEKERKELRKERLAEKLKDDVIQTRRLNSLRAVAATAEFARSHSRGGKGRHPSPESRIKLSRSKTGILAKTYYLMLLDVSPHIAEKIVNEPKKKIIKARKAMRKLKELPQLDESQIKNRVAQAHHEIKLEREIQKAFAENQKESRLFYLPLTQRIVADSLPKIYPLEKLSQKKREELVYRMAKSIINNYDVNNGMEYLPYLYSEILRRVSLLPESPIYQKINN